MPANRKISSIKPGDQKVPLDSAECEDREMKYCAFDHESKYYATMSDLQEVRTEIEKGLKYVEKRINETFWKLCLTGLIGGLVGLGLVILRDIFAK
ncbi:MAG: hypothetical protein M2R45_05234 [Verrucomicrobia subdivision 3 bacterium]|nr:hypothetical protein [Limisphaerales bacterium]MCS1417466.1 hypothetical protein [Limisphaerales bacterium]